MERNKRRIGGDWGHVGTLPAGIKKKKLTPAHLQVESNFERHVPYVHVHERSKLVQFDSHPTDCST